MRGDSGRRALKNLAAMAVAVAIALVLLCDLIMLGLLSAAGGRPLRSDAVVVLSGDRGERLRAGIDLVRRSGTPVLVLDGEPDSLRAERLCQGGQSFEVVCLRPRPDSTRAEARAAADLVRARGWRAITVVTTTFHTRRAGLLFRRCSDVAVTTIGADPPYGLVPRLKFVVHESLGLAWSLVFQRGC